MTDFAAFLKKHSVEIGSLAAIVGVIIGVVGFTMTIYQLKITDRTLRAANSYQIQKDAREIIGKLSENGLMRKIMIGQPLSENEQAKIRVKLWKMHNFYLSVFRQYEVDGINEEFSKAFKNDFCSFIQIDQVTSEWKIMVSNKMLSKSHQRMKEVWCG